MRRCLVTLVMLAGWITTAAAAPVSLTFTGAILSTDPFGPYAGLTGSFTGGISYDAAGIDQNSQPDAGEYQFLGSPYEFFLDLPGSQILAPASSVGVYDDGAGFFPTDTMWLGTRYQAVEYVVQLSGPNGSFAGDLIPPESLIASFWDTGSFRITLDFENWLVGRIDSVNAIPEPSGLPLLVCGLLALVVYRRRVFRAGSCQRSAA